MTSRNDKIRESAYFIWLNRGCPVGEDLAIWCEAERLCDLAALRVSAPRSTALVRRPEEIRTLSIRKAPKPVVKKTAAKKPAAGIRPLKTLSIRKVPAPPKATTKPAPKKPAAKKPAPKKAGSNIIPMKRPVSAKKPAAKKTKIRIVLGARK